jgi:hypothetical protein
MYPIETRIAEMVQIFVSHTKKDEQFCDKFDRIFAREEKIKAFRSEFEDINPPAWTTIKDAINDSTALVLLVGEGLVNNQRTIFQDSSWKFTQNWIAFEIGVACQKGIDVWAICDEAVKINFPMPYISNYVASGFDRKFEFFRSAFMEYVNDEKTYNYPYKKKSLYKGGIKDYSTKCPYSDCKIKFNLMQKCKKDKTITCPQCLRDIRFKHDHPRIETESA